jgi:hypothetical protein
MRDTVIYNDKTERLQFRFNVDILANKDGTPHVVDGTPLMNVLQKNITPCNPLPGNLNTHYSFRHPNENTATRVAIDAQRHKLGYRV